MAILNEQDFLNAKRDIDDIGESVNIEKIITPRFGNPYKSLPLAVKEVIETGGFEPFATEAELLASVPILTKKAAYALDTHKIFLWENGWKNTGKGIPELMKVLISDSENSISDLNVAFQVLTSVNINFENTLSDLEKYKYDSRNINKDLLVGLNSIASAISDFDDVEYYFSESESLKRTEAFNQFVSEISKIDGFNTENSNISNVVISNVHAFAEPKKIIKINLITTEGLPDAKGEVRKGEVTIDFDGQVLSKPCGYEVQGSSSAFYPKKNFTFGFFNDDAHKEEVQVKIGEILPHQELVFKANWIDHTHVRNIGANRIWKQMQATRKAVPVRDIDHTYVGKTGLEALETGALAHVQGYPAIMYVNGNFYGLGCLNIGKKRQNYNLPKNKPEKIFLEINHWTEVSVLDTVNVGWNGSEIVEIKTPSTVTTATQQFIQGLRDFAALPQAEFTTNLAEKLDKNNIIDFMLFVDLICSVDLVSSATSEIKNVNLISWDGKKWFFIPYDLDTVFGLDWTGATIDPPPTWSLMNGPFWQKIRAVYLNDIQSRYAELRKSIFTVNNLYHTLRDINSKYSAEMYQAEFDAWVDLPSKNITSLAQILDWATKRLVYLDSKYNHSI